MSKLHFNHNDYPTLGVELELALVDRQTGALTSSISDLLGNLEGAPENSVKPELMQCYVEVNTAICRTVGEVEQDLRFKLQRVQQAADRSGIMLLWVATHPFSLWSEQQVTPTDRYRALVDLLQDMARQLITFGLHIHVGVESGDKAVQIGQRIGRYLPLLLALSSNSPFWEGRVTGLNSTRSKIMDGLPTAGLPPVMASWSEYTWLVNHLVETGFINTIREIWWDVRPHHNFGTVEVRICDMPGSLDDALALTALTQCLVRLVSTEIDEGAYIPDLHPLLVKQNKWRAGRFGAEARLVDGPTLETLDVASMLGRLLPRLAEHAADLKCEAYLDGLARLARGETAARRQLELFRELQDSTGLVQRLAGDSAQALSEAGAQQEQSSARRGPPLPFENASTGC